MPVLRARIGGAWVDVGGGGGSDEVWISDTAPAGTTQELWYDTDEPNLFDPDTARWNSAWGVVGSSKTSVPQTGVGTSWTTLNNIAVPFTAVAGRRYKVTGLFDFRQRTSSAAVVLKLIDQVTGGDLLWGLDYVAYADVYGFNTLTLVDWTPTAGPHTARMAGATGGPGTVDFNTYGGSSLSVEDVGPVSMSSNPPAQPASVWTNMALLNGWTNIGGSSTPAQYRLLGDVVQIRGELAYVSGFGNPFAVLPAGMRPSTISTFPLVNRTTATAALQLSIDTGGGLNVLGIAGNTQFGLGMISFSVTP